MNAKPQWIYKGNLEEEFHCYSAEAEGKELTSSPAKQILCSPCFLLPFISISFPLHASSWKAVWLLKMMPQKSFIHMWLNLFQHSPATTARWIKPEMEAGISVTLDWIGTVSVFYFHGFGFFLFGSISSHSCRTVSLLTNLNHICFAKQSGKICCTCILAFFPTKLTLLKQWFDNVGADLSF